MITIVRKGYSPKQRAMMRTFKTNMNQLHELITDDNPPLNHVTNEPCGVVVLQHHEGITHKGDLFTKFLEPIKFQKGLGLIKMGEAKLPPPLKKGKVVQFPPPSGKDQATAAVMTNNNLSTAGSTINAADNGDDGRPSGCVEPHCGAGTIALGGDPQYG